MSHKPKILVVGSLVMDQIVTTSVFPREGQTVLGNSFGRAPGGKGANQAVQAARLGAEVTMVGKVGRDANGEELLAACREAGICLDHMLYDETAPSGCSVILLEQGEDGGSKNRIIVLPGANMTIAPEEIAFLETEIRNFDLVILQLEIPMEINLLVAKYAHAAGVPVLLNPAPSAPLSKELLGNLAVIAPNEHEAFDLTGVEIKRTNGVINTDAVQLAASALRAQGAPSALITLGSSGAALDDGSGLTFCRAVDGVVAVDPTAAGDSFIGAYAVAFCLGLDQAQALLFANFTASITVSRMGAMPSLPTLDEVEEKLKAAGICLPLDELR